MGLLIALIGMAVMYGAFVLLARLDRPLAFVGRWIRQHDTDWRLYTIIGVWLFVQGLLS